LFPHDFAFVSSPGAECFVRVPGIAMFVAQARGRFNGAAASNRTWTLLQERT